MMSDVLMGHFRSELSLFDLLLKSPEKEVSRWRLTKPGHPHVPCSDELVELARNVADLAEAHPIEIALGDTTATSGIPGNKASCFTAGHEGTCVQSAVAKGLYVNANGCTPLFSTLHKPLGERHIRLGGFSRLL